MCLKYFFLSKDVEKKKPILYTNIDIRNSPKNNNRNEYNTPYYSPYCRRRPFNAQRRCKNCDKIFYSYDKVNFCSKECSFSYEYSINLSE